MRMWGEKTRRRGGIPMRCEKKRRDPEKCENPQKKFVFWGEAGIPQLFGFAGILYE